MGFISRNSCSCKRQKRSHRHTEEGAARCGWRQWWAWCCPRLGRPAVTRSWKRQEGVFPGAPGGNTALCHLEVRLLPPSPSHEKRKFCCFRSPSLWSFVTAATGNWIHPTSFFSPWPFLWLFPRCLTTVFPEWSWHNLWFLHTLSWLLPPGTPTCSIHRNSLRPPWLWALFKTVVVFSPIVMILLWRGHFFPLHLLTPLPELLGGIFFPSFPWGLCSAGLMLWAAERDEAAERGWRQGELYGVRLGPGQILWARWTICSFLKGICG